MNHLIKSDWHIHTQNSCDDACMTVQDLISEAASLGISDFGITDHVHTPYNLPDIAKSRKEFSESTPSPHFHFGVEASCVSQWEINEIAKGKYKDPVYGLRAGGEPGCKLAIGITAEDIENYAIEYVIGGVHWPMYVKYERDIIIKDYHRQYMFLAAHPLITIVAHPWWWMGHWEEADGSYKTDPWFADFRVIPASMHQELANAIKENKKVLEINLDASLLNPKYPEKFKEQYMEYICRMRDYGVNLSIASDCHLQHYTMLDFAKAEEILDEYGIKAKDLWSLPPRKI